MVEAVNWLGKDAGRQKCEQEACKFINQNAQNKKDKQVDGNNNGVKKTDNQAGSGNKSNIKCWYRGEVDTSVVTAQISPKRRSLLSRQ